MSAAFIALLLTASPSDLETAVELFGREDYAQAAVAAEALVKEPGELGLDARMVLAKSLYRMGLYHSALQHYAVVLAAGPASKHHAKALEWLVFVSRKTVDQDGLVAELMRQPESAYPERYRSELYLLLARWHASKGAALELSERPEARAELAEARRLARRVPDGDELAGRAKYLEAMADLGDGRLAEAVQGFKQVLKLTDEQSTREHAMMQLARTAYAQQQDRFAAAWYSRVPRSSAQWLDAQFESAWAHYRLGDDDRALGALVTLRSPFFQGSYFPEAFVIQAIVHYENCGFAEAKKVVDDFEKEWRPVYRELDALLSETRDASELFARLEGGTGTMRRIVSIALSQPEYGAARDAVLELDAELSALDATPDAFRWSSLVPPLKEALESRRGALKARAGAVARTRLEAERGELQRLLGDALRIRVEVVEREKVPLEEQLRGKKTAGDALVQYEFSREVDEDDAFWPVTNEYWRDELGTYLYTLPQGCAAKRAGQPQALMGRR